LASKKLIVIILSITIAITLYSATIASTNIEKTDGRNPTAYDHYGFVIGQIKDLNRVHSLTHMNCQIVRIYYYVTYLPPYYPYTISGWLHSGILEIDRPYMGIVLPFFVLLPIYFINESIYT
jgi:hypothetical protein